MGLKRNHKAKHANLVELTSELTKVGIASEDLKTYQEQEAMYQKYINDKISMDTKINISSNRFESAHRALTYINKRLSELKKEPRIHIPFTAERKEYKMLKKRKRIAKQSLKIAEVNLDELTKASKNQEKMIKYAKNEMRKKEKAIREIWKQNENEINLIKNVKDNRKQFAAIYGEEGMKIIDTCIKEIQVNEFLPTQLNMSAKDLCNELKIAEKQYKKTGKIQKLKIQQMAKDNNVNVEDLIKNARANFERDTQNPTRQQAQTNDIRNRVDVRCFANHDIKADTVHKAAEKLGNKYNLEPKQIMSFIGALLNNGQNMSEEKVEKIYEAVKNGDINGNAAIDKGAEAFAKLCRGESINNKQAAKWAKPLVEQYKEILDEQNVQARRQQITMTNSRVSNGQAQTQDDARDRVV